MNKLLAVLAAGIMTVAMVAGFTACGGEKQASLPEEQAAVELTAQDEQAVDLTAHEQEAVVVEPVVEVVSQKKELSEHAKWHLSRYPEPDEMEMVMFEHHDEPSVEDDIDITLIKVIFKKDYSGVINFNLFNCINNFCTISSLKYHDCGANAYSTIKNSEERYYSVGKDYTLVSVYIEAPDKAAVIEATRVIEDIDGVLMAYTIPANITIVFE